MAAPHTGKFLEGHRKRVRAKFERDAVGMREDELLELLVGYSIKRKDTKNIARHLLARYKSISGVLDAPPETLLDTPDFGPSSQFLLILVREIIARYLQGKLQDKKSLCSLEALACLVRARLARCLHEEVWVALLDNGNRLINFELVSEGTLDRSLITPRMLMDKAVQSKATALVLVHNHPGGRTKPSVSDINLTNALAEALPLMGVRFLDHLILADATCFSIMSNRLILADVNFFLES